MFDVAAWERIPIGLRRCLCKPNVQMFLVRLWLYRSAKDGVSLHRRMLVSDEAPKTKRTGVGGLGLSIARLEAFEIRLKHHDFIKEAIQFWAEIIVLVKGIRAVSHNGDFQGLSFRTKGYLGILVSLDGKHVEKEFPAILLLCVFVTHALILDRGQDSRLTVLIGGAKTRIGEASFSDGLVLKQAGVVTL